jgi:hypothetical protein
MILPWFKYSWSMLQGCFKYGYSWFGLESILNTSRILLEPLSDSSRIHPRCITDASWFDHDPTWFKPSLVQSGFISSTTTLEMQCIYDLFFLTWLYSRSRPHFNLSWRPARKHWASTQHMPNLCWAKLSTHTTTSADEDHFDLVSQATPAKYYFRQDLCLMGF